MECNMIRDLLPLYIDDCCSEESKKAVREHLDGCSDCRAAYNDMCAKTDIAALAPSPVTSGRIHEFKASVLQSVFLFVSFSLITVSVRLESATPMGPSNGVWACNLMIPATGFLLSLTNWYFIRQYKSRKQFSICSVAATFVFILLGYIWAVVHYKFFVYGSIMDTGSRCWPGLVLTVVLCILSRLLSERYARMLGKE